LNVCSVTYDKDCIRVLPHFAKYHITDSISPAYKKDGEFIGKDAQANKTAKVVIIKPVDMTSKNG
jgi:hypothetical protein